MVYGSEKATWRRVAGVLAQAAASAPTYRHAAEIMPIIDEALAVSSGAGVFFLGPEPLEHPEIRQLITGAVSAGTQRIGVRTSGRPLADASSADELISAGVRVFEVSLLGSCSETHDPLAGAEGSFAAAAIGVRAVLDAAEARGVRVVVRGRLGVCRHTLQDLPAAVRRFAEMRVTSIVLACPGTLESRRFAEWIAAACDTGTVNRVWVAVSDLALETLGDKALHAVDVITMNEAG